MFDIFFVLIAVIDFFCGTLSINEGYYTIIAPGTIQPESKFHISFTQTNYNASCWFNTSFTTFIKNQNLHNFESVEIKPNTTKLIEFESPSLFEQFVNLQVLGCCAGRTSLDRGLIQLSSREHFGMIQTNKFRYKPGELVQFRLICIDQLKRPSNLDSSITVLIFDDQFNIVKKFSDVELIQGVLRGEFRLSNNPLLGIWKIRATSNDIFTEKMFEVDRYSQPKFSVDIKASIVATEKDQIELKISASYFHGEPVKGNLSITVTNIMIPLHTFTTDLPTVTRSIKIDGNTTILLDLKNDFHFEHPKMPLGTQLNPYSFPPGSYGFSAEALVIEDLKEEKSYSQTEFQVNSEPYKIEIVAPETFLARETIKIEVKVFLKDIANRLIKNIPMEIFVGCGLAFNHNRNLIKFDQVRVEYGNTIGEDSVTVNVTNKSYNECYVYATYQGIKSSTERMYKKVEEFDMEILTKSPEEGKELEIRISNPDPFEEFSYEIFSSGDIIQSDRLVIPNGGQTSYILRFNVTSLMVPKITIFAHHVQNSEFGGQLKDVVIQRAVQKSIKISTENSAEPGKPVTLNVKTREGSYVGLMALERSLLHNINENDVFNENYVNKKLKSVNSPISYAIPTYGRTADILTFSNALPKGVENGGVGDLPILKSPEMNRNLLPESWLFEDFPDSPEGGFTVMKNAPKKSSTWAITAFSLHPETGLAFTENATELKIVQNLFVSFGVPDSVKEGEIIEVPVYITNHMKKSTLVNVTMESYSEDILISKDSADISGLKEEIWINISGKKKEKVVFFLKPLQKGQYNITVKTSFSTILKVLNVKSQTKQENVLVAENENEEKGLAKIFEPLLKNLEYLAEFSSGNNEDNMRLIITYSIVLKYFKVLNYTNPELENRIRLNLELSYQNQMNFKFKDGSFGLFGPKDNEEDNFFSIFARKKESGDILQTALAIWGLNSANESIFIDPKVLEAGAMFLRKSIEQDSLRTQSGFKEDVNLTALVLMVFLTNNHLKMMFSKDVASGLSYLSDEQSVKSYLTAYVMFLAKHEKADDYLKELTSKLEEDQKTMRISDDIQSSLKTTVGILLNLIEEAAVVSEDMLNILKGLVASKNEGSSLNQLLVLQAMADIFEKQPSLLQTFCKQNVDDKMAFNDANSLILGSFEPKNDLKTVNFNYDYNVVQASQSSRQLRFNISTERKSKFLSDIKICSEVLANITQEKFFVMEIELQTGYIFEEDNEMENISDEILSLQFNDCQNKAVVYFSLESARETCIKLKIRRSFKVFNSKPSLVTVYGFHKRDQKTAESLLIGDS